jgi:GT2 family glycosyltransferase
MSSMGRSQYIYEVFIIDNGSTDDSVMLINEYERKYKGLIKPIFLDHNTGTTYSRNLAIKQASGKYVAVLDSDVELNDETLVELVATLEEGNGVGLVAPKLVYGNGLLQKSYDQFPTVWRKVYRYLFLKSIEKKERELPLDDAPIEIDYAISAFWLIRKEVIENVGLLDENIFYAPEDVDYCLRIWQHGYKILYVPKVYAIHHAQEISRALRVNKATIEHIKGLIYYFSKHRYLLRKPTFC